VSYEEKKTNKTKPPPTSPLDGKNQTPRIHRKKPRRLAPKIIYPRHVRSQFIEAYRRETETLLQAPKNKRNPGFAKALSGPEPEHR